MEDIPWIYQINPWSGLLAVFCLLFLSSILGYRLGRKVKDRHPNENTPYMPEFIPSTSLGLLALILGFTFSMAISRFEHRRQLVIDEANAIGTAFLRTRLLKTEQGPQIGDLLKKYVDGRIAYYDAPLGETRIGELDMQVQALQEQIWQKTIEATQTDRGAIESIFVNSLNSAFDLKNERNIALTKYLPQIILWAILLISAISLMAFNFVRGERGDRGQWQAAILNFMIAFVFYLIVDIERPRKGGVKISQTAMTDLRDSLSK